MNESDIKLAIIRKIAPQIISRGAMIISEFSFDQRTRRADLAVFDTQLHAFEIKSDADNFRRLEGQLEGYRGRFNKLILVVTGKFVSRALLTPTYVGVWEAYYDKAQQITLRQLRTAKNTQLDDSARLCDLLTLAELRQISKEHLKTERNSLKSRDELNVELSKIKAKRLKMIIIKLLKKRHQSTFDAYSSSIFDMQQSDLYKLSPTKNRLANIKKLASNNEDASPAMATKKINLVKILKGQQIPPTMPEYLIIPSR